MADPKKPSSPFASLAALRDVLPEGPPPPDEPGPSESAATSRFRSKLVIARTRKGRGGKTVTTVDGLEASHDLEELARELRRALGCGTVVEESRLVVQGDQVDRVRAFFEARGATRIVIGS